MVLENAENVDGRSRNFVVLENPETRLGRGGRWVEAGQPTGQRSEPESHIDDMYCSDQAICNKADIATSRAVHNFRGS